MLLELVELTGILGGTLVGLTACSLSYAKSLDARRAAESKKLDAAMRKELEQNEALEREEDDRLRRAARVKEVREARALSPAVVVPFTEYRMGGSCCPKCGVPSVSVGQTYIEIGNTFKAKNSMGIIKVPNACKDLDLCLAGDRPHLHVYCVSCNSEWFMSPKETALAKETDHA